MTRRVAKLPVVLWIVVGVLLATLAVPAMASGVGPAARAGAALPAPAGSNPTPGPGTGFLTGLQLPRPAAQKTAKADWRVADVIASQATSGTIAALDTARSVGLPVAANKVRVIVEAYDPALGLAAVNRAGVAVERSAGNLIAVLATPAQLKQLLAAPAVRYLRPSLPHVADATTVDEAVATTNASIWQQRGQSGAGVKVAIIDLGFTGLAVAQTSGDLPASVTTVNDCGTLGLNGITNHGTAVAELAHKMAPAAQLYLICIDTDVDLAAAEQYATANGIQIFINHSVSWFNSSRGDGSGGPGSPDAIAADALAKGIPWVNAAGNYAQQHWTGTFDDRDGGGYNWFTPTSNANGVYLPSGATTCVELKMGRLAVLRERLRPLPVHRDRRRPGRLVSQCAVGLGAADGGLLLHEQRR